MRRMRLLLLGSRRHWNWWSAHFLILLVVSTATATSSSTMNFDAMMEKVKDSQGFLAALDQSGGSTPKALKAYGIPDDSYTPGEDSMYDKVHAMRTRIMTSPAFTGDKILGAILFENTMDREIEGLPTGEYLWTEKAIVPFLKCDKGLEAEENGVQLMKPVHDLKDLLERAKAKGMFGTKMRSTINSANAVGIKAIVEQQFEVGKQIIGHGLVPILEPEINIRSVDKAESEVLLKQCLLEGLDALAEDQNVMLKLTLPEVVNHYRECIRHPRCICVVALSGGYSRDEANKMLAKQTDMIASFSRALSEGLNHQQSQEEFDAALDEAIDSIYHASMAG